MTPEQAQYLDEAERRANYVTDLVDQWVPDEISEIQIEAAKDVERLTALVRAYAGAWDELWAQEDEGGWVEVPSSTREELEMKHGLDELP